MGKLIRSFKNLSKNQQNRIVEALELGELERTVFPYKGVLQDGIIFQDEGNTYLIPISSFSGFKPGEMESLEDIDRDGDINFESEDLDEE
jgi:hypothetical protein